MTRPWLHMPVDAKTGELTPYSEVIRCQSCELGMISPLPPPAAVPGFYQLGSYYTHGESHIAERASSVSDRVLTKFAWWADRSEYFDVGAMAKMLPAGAKICDLGCGDAKYLEEFRSLGFEVVGVDPDVSARENAGKRGLEVLEGTAEVLPEEISGQRFDLVLMTHSLEHCLDAPLAMRNAHKLTRPGGLCYVEVPNCGSEHFKMFTICSEMFDAPRHIYFFSRAALETMATRSGFIVERIIYGGYVRNFAPSWRAWESEIADRVRRAEPRSTPARHTFTASCKLLLKSFWQAKDGKYDSLGVLLRRVGDQAAA